MKRRSFLKGSLYASAALGMPAGFRVSNAWAAPGARPRSVVNTMLLGGADLRHLFVPPPNTTIGSYGELFWKAREDLYNLNADPAWSAQTVWNSDYFHVTHRGKTFGIHKSAAWLKDQFVLGRVAIICNVKQATNQRHDHATLILNTGDRNAENFKVDVPGWGGKLAYAISTANVLSLTNSVSVFCNGINPANRNERVISAPDMRNVAFIDRTSSSGTDGKLSRSLMAYYARRGVTLENTPYAKFAHHEVALRIQGNNITAALAATSRPQAIKNLYTPGYLYDYYTYLGYQTASLYDVTLVGAVNETIMNMRVASMEVYGWDTHGYQNNALKNLFSDLFGSGKTFDTLTSQMSADANDNMVFTVTSEFGRQLGANGTWGTDHGVGTYMIIFGKPVRGDVYGEMFPQAELPKLPIHYSYIEGLTAFERVLGEVCDWVEPGAANKVFPTRNTLEIEPNVDLRAMFAPAYRVSGTARDSAGIPIPSVTITISGSTGFVWNITSDANGYYSSDALVVGSYSMTFSAKRYDIPPSAFSIVGADVVNNVVGTLYPGTVSGRFTTPTGVPVVGYELWDIMTWPESKTKTDANGNFKFIGIKTGNNVWINAFSGYTRYNIAPSGPLTFVHPGGNVIRDFILTPL